MLAPRTFLSCLLWALAGSAAALPSEAAGTTTASCGAPGSCPSEEEGSEDVVSLFQHAYSVVLDAGRAGEVPAATAAAATGGALALVGAALVGAVQADSAEGMNSSMSPASINSYRIFQTEWMSGDGRLHARANGSSPFSQQFELENSTELVRRALDWKAKAVVAQAESSDTTTAQIARRTAAAAQVDAAVFSTGQVRLYNPSVVDLPPSWRRQPKERWLGAFRHTTNEGSTWSSSYVVLAVLDSELQPVRPLRVLGTQDLFEGAFACRRGDDLVSTFGPEDPRLFLSPGGQGADPKVTIYFNGRAHAPQPNVLCNPRGSQRMFVAELGTDLRPIRVGPLLVGGENDAQDALNLNFSAHGAAGAAPQQGAHLDVGRLTRVEKNWSPFVYRPQEVAAAVQDVHGFEKLSWGQAQVLAEYGLEPHVVMDIDINGSRAAGRRMWNTSSEAVQRWSLSLLSEGIVFHNSVHAGVNAIRIHRDGRPDVFLSVLHQQVRNEKTKDVSYRSALYSFEAAPPFRVLAVGQPLPLEAKPCIWFASVAFPVSLVHIQDPRQPELWVMYGSGDEESRRLVLPWRGAAQRYLPAEPSSEPGLTLVVAGRSRGRLGELLRVLRLYRAMAADVLEEILVVWNDPTDPTVAEEIEAVNAECPGVTLRVLNGGNSLNNRFAVWEAVRTEGVIIQDEGLWVEEPDLRRLIDVWRRNPEDLVGAYGERTHMEVGIDGRLRELSPICEDSRHDETLARCVYWGSEFSSLSPHPWVVSNKYLRRYTEGFAMTRLVDEVAGCDDLYFTAVVANERKAPPIAVEVTVHRFPRGQDGGGYDGLRESLRTRCLEEVSAFFSSEAPSADTGTVWRLAPGPHRGGGARAAGRGAGPLALVLLAVLLALLPS